MASLGVYPVFDIEFKISLTGKIATHNRAAIDAMVKIAEMETFEPSIDGNVEEWNPMDAKGWVRRLMTGKGFGIGLNGKRYQGDPGNDYVAGLALKTGTHCSSTAAVVFPNGDAMIFDTVVNVSRHFGGDSVNVSALEFELMSDGKPTYLESGGVVMTIMKLEQVGGAPGTADSTAIRITLDKDVSGLLASHITLSAGTGAATKGALTGANKVWTIAISAVSQGTVGVKISGLSGYIFPASETMVNVYGVVTVGISSIEQVGGAPGTADSTAIRITLDKDVSGLLASHITLSAGTGAATKGALTGANKVWTIAISAVSQGTVGVKISGLSGYIFPASETMVNVYSD
jgi:hypothetical protein